MKHKNSPLFSQIDTLCTRIRGQKPLVLCLTNHVSMDLMANGLLAIGASPLMSVAVEEVDALVALSCGLLVNIGTLDRDFLVRAHKAADQARSQGKPIVLDPVGAGASAMRTQAARDFLGKASIVKGNATEILALCGSGNIKSSGADSCHAVDDVKEGARRLAQDWGCVVVVTGEKDFVTNGMTGGMRDGTREETIAYGSPMMGLVTGVGCLLGGMMAASCGVEKDVFLGVTAATYHLALAGNKAHIMLKDRNELLDTSIGPGSFRVALLDYLGESFFSLF